MSPRRSQGSRGLPRAPPSRFSRWASSLANFSVEGLFGRKRVEKPPRTVFINEPLPQDYYDPKGRILKDKMFPTNQIITSKYTVITFLPRNLLEQFRRIANIFFLAIAILQFFSTFSTISPGLVILPLLIVLGITAIKDGYEDIKRHQSDRRVNNTKVRVLAGGEWSNPNPMSGKTRTFIRGVPNPKALIPSKRSSDVELSGQQLSSTDVEAGEPVEEPSVLHADDESLPHWRLTAWEDVRVGDFVMIMDHEPFPADMLICATSEDENVAFVETKNLDGETNLKSRNAVPGLTHLRNAVECASKKDKFKVECDRPDVNMYKLNAAVVNDQDERMPVDFQMTFLRGTVLRNTAWAIGLVMYTGEDTKIIMNSGVTPSKRSRVERQMNPQVLINLAILLLMCVVCGIVDSVLEHEYYPKNAPWLYLDNQSDDNPSINGLITFVFAMITFQNIIPISLYISLEAVRTLQALFIYFDKDIWYEKTDQATLARTWNLSDDLGQIEYIFSDKTGTLTQNSMAFRQCSIGGKVYKGDDAPSEDKRASSQDSTPTSTAKRDDSSEDTPNPLGAKPPIPKESKFHDPALAADLSAAGNPSANDDGSFPRILNGFFSVLALCHTVLTAVDPNTGAIEYRAQSPDEAALVQAAADVGYIFRGREREILNLQTPFSDTIERYELLNILDFTSARKRMSVIVRRADSSEGRVFLLCKGADNVIFERLKKGKDEELRKVTEKHLDEFASQGLRTLTLAFKAISEEDYEQWSHRYHEATVAMENREEQIESVSNEIEQDLRLLGSTAIEDKLQDGVPETIADLKRAGIKIWVATGDKLETAIAIAQTTNLIGRESNIIIIKGGGEKGRPVREQLLAAFEEFFDGDGFDLPSEEQSSGRPTSLRRVNTGVSSIVGADNGNRPGGFVLVIDGAALTQAFDSDDNKNLLLALAMKCEGVVCCRVSPLQKALIVRLVKDGIGAMCLAIGDGANDVSMIQAADVGVGISGEEGLQAVNSSDYAIAQFRFLKKLVLVHGHWSYARNGNMIVNFFYKNVICVGVLWWFQIYCAWSAEYAFDYTYLLFWNSFWTIAPVIAMGLFDRLVDYDVLMTLPELYRYGREHRWFGIKLFLIYMLDGVYQSAVIFFLCLYAYYTTTAREDGYEIGQFEWTTTAILAAVMTANLTNGLNTNVWTGWVFFALALGIVLVWAFTAIYSIISPGWFVTDVFGNDYLLFHSAYFWLCLPITILISLLPRYVAKAYKFGYAPNDIDIMRWIKKYDPQRDISRDAERMNTLNILQRSSSRVSRVSLSTSRLSRRHSRIASNLSSASRAESLGDISLDPRRPSMDMRVGSRTDMSTGQQLMHRGFDFSTEEHGVAMRRMQSNLSERHSSRLQLPTSSPRQNKIQSLFHLRSSARKKQRPSTSDSK